MKIEVDTKGDSKEEIMHAIKLLKAAIGGSSLDEELSKETFSNEPEEDTIEAEPNAGFMNFFSDNSIKEKETFSNETEESEESEEENNGFMEESKAPQEPSSMSFFDMGALSSVPTNNTENEENSSPLNSIIEEIPKEESKVESYDSFYKDFKDDEDESDESNKEEEKEESFSNQEKPKKKLFNVEFY